MVDIIEKHVTLSLPEWCCDEIFEYYREFFYDEHHIWAGQYKERKYYNRIDDSLFEYGYTELCLHPCGAWVRIEIPEYKSPEYIKEEVEQILNPFEKEYRRKKNA